MVYKRKTPNEWKKGWAGATDDERMPTSRSIGRRVVGDPTPDGRPGVRHGRTDGRTNNGWMDKKQRVYSPSVVRTRRNVGFAHVDAFHFMRARRDPLPSSARIECIPPNLRRLCASTRPRSSASTVDVNKQFFYRPVPVVSRAPIAVVVDTREEARARTLTPHRGCTIVDIGASVVLLTTCRSVSFADAGRGRGCRSHVSLVGPFMSNRRLLSKYPHVRPIRSSETIHRHPSSSIHSPGRVDRQRKKGGGTP